MASKNGAARAATITTRKTAAGNQVRFHVTAEQMADVELGDLLDIEEHPNDVRLIMRFMNRFMVDEHGEPLPEDEAAVAIRRVTLGQLKAAFEQVTGSFQEASVPNG